MKRNETLGNDFQTADVSKKAASAGAQYEQVFEGRKQRVRGLWKRGSVFYGRILATDQAGRKRDIFRALDGAETVPAAKIALQRLRDEANTRTIPVNG